MGASSIAREREAHMPSKALNRRPSECWRWLGIFLKMYGFSQRGTNWRRYYTGIGSFHTHRWNSAEETTQVQWTHRCWRPYSSLVADLGWRLNWNAWLAMC